MTGAPSYFVVPLVGPDGAGKSTLLRALAQAIGGAPRSVSVGGVSCDVLDVRAANGFVQLVDFPNVAAQRALLPTSGAGAVVLVVDVKDSVTSGTVDALLGAHMLGLRVAAAVVTQSEAIDEELAELVALEVTDLLAKHAPHAPAAPVVTLGAREVMEGARSSRAAVQTLLAALGCR